jgi:DNA-binding response OmpR family regulator
MVLADHAAMFDVRVLIVEDDESVRTAIARAVRKHHCDVVEAGDGISALRAIRQETFGVVVLDLRLPGVSGKDVLNGLRELQDVPPVIVISASRGDLQEIAGESIVSMCVDKTFALKNLAEVASIVAMTAKRAMAS